MKESNKGSALVVVLSIVAGLLAAALVTLLIIFNLPSNRLNRALKLAEKYLNNEEYDAAIEQFNKAIDIDPKCEDAYIGLANAYVELAKEKMDNGDVDKAVKYYEKAIKALEKGYDKTDSDDIKELLAEVEKDLKKAENPVEEASAEDQSDITATDDSEVAEAEIETVPMDYYANAYTNMLNFRSYALGYYYWQFDYHQEWYSFLADEPTPVVSLSDITGDGCPELLLATAAYNEDASLSVYMMDGADEATEVLNTELDIRPNEDGGDIVSGYALFKTNENNCFYKLRILNKGYECYKYTYTNYGFNEEIVDDYEPLISKASELIMYNKQAEDFVRMNFLNVPFKGMTKGEAMRLLAVNENPEPGHLPINQPLELCFASGAGGWSTYLVLFEDGSFEGSYYDSDMGVTGPGYPNGTCYASDFYGEFTDIEKVNEYTYKMTLSWYDTKMEPGTSEISEETLYEYTDPYGIAGGVTFYLYLPNTSADKLPPEFIEWINMPTARDNKLIEFFGLYNYDEQCGFGAY